MRILNKPFCHCLIASLIFIIACESEPTGPDINCDLQQSYQLDYSAIMSGKAYDISQTPPEELKNSYLTTLLLLQYPHGADPLPLPYDRYFIMNVEIIDEDNAKIYYKDNNPVDYNFVRDDCQIDFFLPGDTLHTELTRGGNEISIERYAIYEHVNSTGLDSFSFIEFRPKLFQSYEEVIAAFAADNAGLYDTIVIELSVNKTKE